jgi:thioredoxin 2
MDLACPSCLAVNHVRDADLDGPLACDRCGAPLLPAAPVDLDAAGFAAFVAHAGLPVLTDFWAEWCAPCRTLAPAFAAVAAELRTHLRCVRIDNDAHPQISMRLHLRGVPTLVLFRDGVEVARTTGALDAYALRRWLAAQGIG